MAIKEDVTELLERLLRIEGELKLLQEDRKVLFEEFKDKLDVKAFKSALQIAKIRSKAGTSESELDNILQTVLDSMSV